MQFPSYAEAEELKHAWTDKFVRVKTGNRSTSGCG